MIIKFVRYDNPVVLYHSTAFPDGLYEVKTSTTYGDDWIECELEDGTVIRRSIQKSMTAVRA